MEVQRVVPSWLDSLNTINDSYAVDAWSSSYTMKVLKFFLCHGSADFCIELVCCIEYHKDFYAVEVRRVVLSWLAATSTIKDPTPRKPEGLYKAGLLQ